MKKVLILTIMAIFMICQATNAQTTYPSEKITVNAADLTPDQLAKIKLEQVNAELEKKIETYGKWVGVGGEIGTAVKEGLTAVVDVADKFGSTDVGKFTLVMVAWKVMGKDMVRIFLGLIFIIVFTVFIFRVYRKTFTTYKVSNNSNGIKFWLPKTYTLVTPVRWDGYEAVKILFLFLYAGGIGLTYAIMFG
jgi:hypothetical protein